jgi:hypothetical protein
MTQPKLVVVILVPHYWGKGETIKAAWKRITQESGTTMRELKRNPYRINVVPETEDFSAYVDSMGTLHWADVEGMQSLVVEQFDKKVKKAVDK